MAEHMTRHLEVGKWNKLPHYVVVGDPQKFYVWVNEDGRGENSDWIKGKDAFELWHRLKRLQEKDKPMFVSLVKDTLVSHGKK